MDTKHHIVVAHEVTNKGSDRRQLANMAKQAKSVIDTEELTAVADRGYYRSEELRATVEHPFGTLKAWMGSIHFLTKTLDKVSTEMSLHVLAYNMKRMMNIIGTKPLIEAIRA